MSSSIDEYFQNNAPSNSMIDDPLFSPMTADELQRYDPLNLRSQTVINNIEANKLKVSMSMEDKLAKASSHTTKKLDDLTNTEVVKIKFSDLDSGTVIFNPEYGEERFRLKGFDAGDYKKSILASGSKSYLQIPVLENIFGKPFFEISDDEIENFHNYQLMAGYHYLVHNSAIEGFDKDKQYKLDFDPEQEIEVRVRREGFDDNGRHLLNLYRMSDNEDISDTFGNNPWLNMNYGATLPSDLALDNNTFQGIMNNLAKADLDETVGETVQRLLKECGISWNQGWAQFHRACQRTMGYSFRHVADWELEEEMQNLAFGLSNKDRAIIRKNVEENEVYWASFLNDRERDYGKLVTALGHSISMIGILAAQSFGQTSTAIAATAAGALIGAGIGAITGAGAGAVPGAVAGAVKGLAAIRAAHIIGGAVGSVVNALQQTGSDIHDFEQLHGRKITSSEAADMFWWNCVVYTPQAIFGEVILGTMGKSFSSRLNTLLAPNPGFHLVSNSTIDKVMKIAGRAALTTIGSGLYETGEEWAQQAMSYSNVNSVPWLEAIWTTEAKMAAGQAFILGGAFGFGGGMLSGSIIRGKSTRQQAIENLANARMNMNSFMHRPITMSGTVDQNATDNFNLNYQAPVADFSQLTSPRDIADAVTTNGDDLIVIATNNPDINVSSKMFEFSQQVAKAYDSMEIKNTDGTVNQVNTDLAKRLILNRYIGFLVKMNQTLSANGQGTILSSTASSDAEPTVGSTLLLDLQLSTYFSDTLTQEEKTRAVREYLIKTRGYSEEKVNLLFTSPKAIERRRNFAERLATINQQANLTPEEKIKNLNDVTEELCTDVEAAAEALRTSQPGSKTERQAKRVIERLFFNHREKFKATLAALHWLVAKAAKGTLIAADEKSAEVVHKDGSVTSFNFKAHNLYMARKFAQGNLLTYLELVRNELLQIIDVMIDQNYQFEYITKEELLALKAQINALFDSNDLVTDFDGHKVASIMSSVQTITDALDGKIKVVNNPDENTGSNPDENPDNVEPTRHEFRPEDNNETSTDEQQQQEETVEEQVENIEEEAQQVDPSEIPAPDYKALAIAFIQAAMPLSDLILGTQYNGMANFADNFLSNMSADMKEVILILAEHFPGMKATDAMAKLAKDPEFIKAVTETIAEMDAAAGGVGRGFNLAAFSKKKKASERRPIDLINFFNTHSDSLFNTVAFMDSKEKVDADTFIKKTQGNATRMYGIRILNDLKSSFKSIQKNYKAIDKESKNTTNKPGKVPSRSQALRDLILLKSYKQMAQRTAQFLDASDSKRNAAKVRDLNALADNCDKLYHDYEFLLKYNTGSILAYDNINAAISSVDESHLNLSATEAQMLYGAYSNHIPINDENVTDVEKNIILGNASRFTRMYSRLLTTKLLPDQKDALKQLVAESRNIVDQFTAIISKSTKHLHNLWNKTGIFREDKELHEHVMQIKQRVDKEFQIVLPVAQFIDMLRDNKRTIGFMYDLANIEVSKDESTVTLKFNEEFIAYSMAAIPEFFNSQEYAYLINPTTLSDACRAFDVDEDSAYATEIFQKALLHGTPLSTVSNALGKLICKHMNLHGLSTGYHGDMANLASKMGFIMMHYLMSNNVYNMETKQNFKGPIFQEDTVTLSRQEKATNSNEQEKTYNTVKLNPIFFTDAHVVFQYSETAETEINKKLMMLNGKDKVTKDYIVFDTETANDIRMTPDGKFVGKHDADGNPMADPDHDFAVSVVAKRVHNGKVVASKRIWINYDGNSYQIPEFLGAHIEQNRNTLQGFWNKGLKVNVVKALLDLKDFMTIKDSDGNAIGQYVVVGHNILGYDVPILQRMAKDAREQGLVDEDISIFNDDSVYIDTYQIALATRVAGQVNSLVNLTNEVTHDPSRTEDAHDADVDVNNNITVFQAQLDSLVYKKEKETPMHISFRNSYLKLRDTVKYRGDNLSGIDNIIRDINSMDLEITPDYIRNTNGLVELTPAMQDILRYKNHVEYTMSRDVADLLSSVDPHVLALILGVKDDTAIKALPSQEERIIARGEKEGLMRELKGCLAVAEAAAGKSRFGMFFKWFWARNGRIMMNGSSINPQSLKYIQRFLIQPKQDPVKKDLVRGNIAYYKEKVLRSFLQSMDETLEDFLNEDGLGSLDDIMENLFTSDSWDKMPQILQDLSEGKAVEIDYGNDLSYVVGTKDCKEDTVTYVDDKEGEYEVTVAKIENFGQFLAALADMHTLATMDSNPETTVNLYSTYELDCANSGNTIRTLVFGETEDQATRNSMGIFYPGDPTQGNDDNYVLVAKQLFGSIFDENDELDEDKVDRQLSIAKDILNRELLEYYTDNVGISTFIALGKEFFASTKTKTWKARRKFVKPGSMTDAYNAQMNTISANMAELLFKDQYLPAFTRLKGLTTAEVEAVLDPNSQQFDAQAKFMVDLIDSYLGKGKWVEVLTGLDKKLSSEIFLKTPKKDSQERPITLRQAFFEIVKYTYGVSLTNVLKSRSNFTKHNLMMNTIAQYAYDTYRERYDAEYAKLREQYGNDISNEAYSEMLRRLEPYRATLTSFFGGMVSPITFSTFQGTPTTTDVYFAGTKQEIATSDLTLSVPGYSSCVIPIHMLDSIILLLFEKHLHDKGYDIASVFDAIFVPTRHTSVGDIDGMAQVFNQIMLSVTKSFNLAEEFGKLFQKTYDLNMDPQLSDRYKTHDNEPIHAPFGGNYTVTDYNGLHISFVKDLKEAVNDWVKEVQDKVTAQNTSGFMFNNIGERDVSLVDSSMPNPFDTARGNDLEFAQYNRYYKGFYTQEELDSMGENEFASSATLRHQDILDDSNPSIVLGNTANNKRDRINLFVQVAKDEGISDERIAEYVELLKLAPDMNFMFDVEVHKDSAVYNLAQYDVTYNDVGRVRLFTEQQGYQASLDKTPYRDMTATEALMHDYLHPLSWYAINRSAEGHASGLKTRLMRIWQEAKENLTPEDLIPAHARNASPDIQAAYKAWADKLYKALFDSSNLDRALTEFYAYSLSNAHMKELLSNIKTKQESKSNIFKTAKDTIMKLFSIVFGGTRFVKIFKNFNSIILGETPMLNKGNLYADLKDLHKAMVKANAQAIENIRNHQPIESKFVQAFGKVLAVADIKGSTFLKRLLNKVSSRSVPVNFWDNLVGKNGRFNQARAWLYGLRHFAYDAGFRDIFLNVVSHYSWKQYSMLWNIINDLRTPTDAKIQMDKLNLNTRSVESLAKETESAELSLLREAFGNDIDDKDKMTKLTHVVLRSDLQCLLSKYTYEDIRDILSNGSSLYAAIKADEQAVEDGCKDEHGKINKLNKFLCDRFIHMLLRFISTGKSNLLTLHNARQIVSFVFNNDKNMKMVEAIDRLVTLQYLQQMTDAEMRTTVCNLNKEALHLFINSHRNYVSDSYTNASQTAFVQPEHIQKGYVKYSFDGSTDVRIFALKRENDLKKKGFVLIGKFSNEAGEFGLFQKQYVTIDKWVNGAVPLTGDSPHFIDISNLYDMLSEPTDSISEEQFTNDERNKLIHKRNELLKQLKLGKLDDAQLDALEGSFGVQLDNYGTVRSFFLMPSYADINTYAEPNTNGCTTLAYMQGNAVRKMKASQLNESLLNFLQMNMELHMDRTNHVESYTSLNNPRNGMRYVEVSNKSKDARIREVWSQLPITVQKYCKENNLWVPEDWVLDIFGTHQQSLADTDWKYINEMPIVFKKALAFSEQLLRFIAGVVRDNIIYGMPSVLCKNVLGNILLSVVTLRPDKVWTVLKYQYQAAKDTKRYLDAKFEYDEITHLANKRDQRGAMTDKERARVAVLSQIMKDSPIRVLMENNMFSSIIQDIQLSRRDNTAYMKKVLTDNAVGKRIAKFKSYKGVSKAFDFLTLGESNGIYRTMYIATQYSDFIARAAEWYMRTEHPVGKNGVAIKKYKDSAGTFETEEFSAYKVKLLDELLYKFVNYELPVSDTEQFLNDISIIRFAKWRRRIQWVITNSVIDNPISTLLSVAVSLTTGLGPIPASDSMFWNVSAMNPMWNPLDTWINAATPRLFHFVNNF